ncbi:MAG: hypothetical protein P1V81_01075 [Planctomycetota bacterium]|nr:hypothetical protein [Planctomycetota bacterium]
MDTCTTFRAHLRAALEGGVTAEHGLSHDGRPLAWHDHLHHCAGCRELLESEQALDELLASLPEPRLPLALAQRVLSRLARQGELGDLSLDAVLELADEASVPVGLAGRVLAGLEEARDEAEAERRLDNLLEVLPEPSVPQGLADRVLAGVRLDQLLDQQPEPAVPAGLAARTLAATRPTPVLRPQFGRWAAAAAAALVVVFAGTRFFGGQTQNTELNVARSDVESPASIDGPTAPAAGTSELAGAQGSLPDLELLESLDVLEDWELLMSEDVDLLLGSLDDVDLELLLAGGVEEEQG